MMKLNDSHASCLGGSLLIATRREGVDRPTSSKGSKNNEAYVCKAKLLFHLRNGITNDKKNAIILD